jgi:hypothetical protein
LPQQSAFSTGSRINTAAHHKNVLADHNLWHLQAGLRPTLAYQFFLSAKPKNAEHIITLVVAVVKPK